MSEERELYPTERPPRDARVNAQYKNLGGPLRHSDPAKRGNIDVLCPHCGAVLIEEAREDVMATVEFIQCYKCEKFSTGVQQERGK